MTRRSRMGCWAAVLPLLLSCSSSVPPPPPSGASGSAAARPLAPITLEGAPVGLVTPAAGTVRKLHPGTKGTSYTWRVVMELAPDDPLVARTKAEPSDEGFPESWDAGDVGLVLYLRQVRAQGIHVTTYGPLQFAYVLPNGDEAMVFSKDQLHPGDPTGFTISVGPAGG